MFKETIVVFYQVSIVSFAVLMGCALAYEMVPSEALSVFLLITLTCTLVSFYIATFFWLVDNVFVKLFKEN